MKSLLLLLLAAFFLPLRVSSAAESGPLPGEIAGLQFRQRVDYEAKPGGQGMGESFRYEGPTG